MDDWFPEPDAETGVLAKVCPQSGYLAGPSCPVTEESLELLPPACLESDPCPYHDDGEFVLPPAMEWYYRRRHLDYQTLPPKHPQFDAASGGFNPIDVIYPQPGTTLVPTRGLDGRKKGAVLRAAHSDPDAVLYWYVDGVFAGETRGEHEIFFAPDPGAHVLTLVDGEGYRRSVPFNGA